MTRKLSNVLKIMETIISNLEIDNQTIKMLFRHVLKKKSLHTPFQSKLETVLRQNSGSTSRRRQLQETKSDTEK